MNEEETALAVVQTPPEQTLALFREPTVVLAEAHKAAAALNDVLQKKKNKFMLNGEQYIEYEDWQLLGRFYNVAVDTSDVQEVEINGVKGAKCIANLVNSKTGELIGKGAVAYCMKDEKLWGTRPWNQIASMAQTRAGAKAFRNHLSWIVVLAGYKPTTAEELKTDVIDTSHGEEAQVFVKISDKQAKRLFAILKTSGIHTEDELKQHLKTSYNIEHSLDIDRKDYDSICDWAAGKE